MAASATRSNLTIGTLGFSKNGVSAGAYVYWQDTGVVNVKFVYVDLHTYICISLFLVAAQAPNLSSEGEVRP